MYFTKYNLIFILMLDIIAVSFINLSFRGEKYPRKKEKRQIFIN